MRTIRNAFPICRCRSSNIIVEGNKVACRWLAAGNAARLVLQHPLTEAQCTWSGTSVYVVNEDGVIGSMTELGPVWFAAAASAALR